MQKTRFHFRQKKLSELCAIALPLMLMTMPAQGDTDLTNVPLATQTTVKPKPNLLFILDDSGSMTSEVMPDDMGGPNSSYSVTPTNWYGTYSPQCNGLAFDPNNSYPPPMNADGSTYPNVSFTAAPDDGYKSTSAKADLSSKFYFVYKGTQKAMNWTYTSTYKVDKTTTFYQECSTLIDGSKTYNGTPSGTKLASNSVFTLFLVNDQDATVKQNYANWYSYYRKRYMLMRTAMGRAVAGLDSSYRVGFATINSSSVTDGTSYFRDVKDFDATQKTNFYKSLYEAPPTGSTPLLAALSRAGRYYAKKETGQKYDPVQYSCQRNYALLSTDGYWNSSSNTDLNGKSVGDQDSTEARPMLDAEKAANKLADVAQYYYKTDLRTSELGNCISGSSNQNVCENTVRPAGDDKATWQHLNTFTIGLGVSGTLEYDPNYLTQTTGSYIDIKNGAKDWPAPAASGGDVRTVDDLWHAAVNGRGQYYSALNATALKDAINGVISFIQAAEGSGTAPATSSLELMPGDDNVVFQAGYSIPSWTSDVKGFSLNGDTGEVGASALWSAQAQLDAATSRNVYFRNASGNLQAFEYANLNATQKAYFTNLCSRTPKPNQCDGLSAPDLALANSGANLVNYLAGNRTYENASGGVAALYRKRDHLLGDIVDSNLTYVGKPPFLYADTGYANYAEAKKSRTPMAYVGANDGMLHAFSAGKSGGGQEKWAYVPGQVMANMPNLADTGYANRHQYFVNGQLVVGDIQVGGSWKTILVGGFGAGGKGYFALDVTNPEAPVSLWEFTDPNMGYSFGNPIITKRADGTWVVAVTSGYNNNDTGDGKGHLFVLNANTGAKLLDIATSEGSKTAPSGLGQLNAWVPSTTDNTATRFYAGDLLGNLWRFDIDNLVAPKQGAQLLASFVAGTTPQPITTKPELVEIEGFPVVIVGTGRYLGVSDITDVTQQSVYAVKDPLTASGWGDVRRSTTFVKQTITLNGNSAKITSNDVDWKTKAGWMVDLPHSKERVAISPTLQYTTLAIATAIPSGDACASGGASWLYYLDVANAHALLDDNVVGKQADPGALIIGDPWIKDATGKLRLIAKFSDGSSITMDPPVKPPVNAANTNRTSWRELID